MRQTVLAVLAMALVGVLIFLNYASPVFSKQFIDPNQIQGVDVYYKGIPYTLNMSQQNALLALVNNSLTIQTLPALQENASQVDKVVFYPLGQSKPLVLILKGENSVHFTYFTLDGKAFKEPQPGHLKELLETTYDS